MTRPTCLLLSLLISIGVAMPATAAPPTPAKTTTAQRAHELFRQGKYTEALRAYEEIITARRNTGVAAERQYAELLLEYGRALAAAQKYEEAHKMLSQSLAIADAFVLPGEFKRSIEAEVEKVKQHLPQDRDQPWVHSRSVDHNYDHPDAAEHEYLLKAAIEYAKDRYGAGSLTYITRHLEYAQFLAEQRRQDDLAKEASLCREIFSKLAPDFQAQVAPRVITFAQTLADHSLPIAADTVGSIVMNGIMSGTMPSSTDVASHLERLASALERHGNSELAQKYFAASVRAFEKNVPADDPRLAKMRTALANFYRKVGKNGAAIELLELAVAAQGKNSSTTSPDAVTAMTTLTELYCMTGSLDKAKDTAGKLVTAISQQATDGHSTPTTPLPSILQTAGLLAAKGQYDEAEQLYTAAFKSLTKNKSNSYHHQHYYPNSEVSRAVKELATRLGRSGNADLSEKVFDAWIESSNSALGQPTQATLNALLEKTNFFIDQELYDKVDSTLAKVVELNKRFSQGNHYTLNEIARNLMQRKQYEPALKAQLAWLESTDIDRHPNEWTITEAKTRVAKIYHALGKDQEAKASMQELQNQSFEKMPPSMAAAQPILKSSLDKMADAGHFDPAVDLLQAIAQSRSYSTTHDALSRPAHILQNEKLFSEAEQLLLISLDLQSKTYGPSSYQAGNTMRHLAAIYAQLGDNVKSQDMLKGAQAISMLHSRQLRGAGKTYDPKAPLAETIKAAESLGDENASSLRRLPPAFRQLQLENR